MLLMEVRRIQRARRLQHLLLVKRWRMSNDQIIRDHVVLDMEL
jgi:hypothetical protein